ncbi:MAG: prephenate dehydratase [Cytophagales bacterium]|nr:MAG: prephenate dehydratase [Cytophagales bacterium]
MKISIQGGKASFHDIAAHHYFGNDITSIYRNTFKEVCDDLQSGIADFAVLAIENSIAGTILSNYALIKKYDFKIIGEIQLRIEMNLIALKGAKMEDIKVVRSHYMALLQCQQFLNQYPHIKVEEYHDTADSAKKIKEEHELGAAAIAGRMAADVYDLEVLESSIETEKKNFTKFFILTRDKKYKVEQAEKATLSFQLPNRIGALAELLTLVVNNGINLTKIQSIPILGRPDEYDFFIECEWNKNYI